MIILKVIGGLGNQIFQIAYARMLSLEEGEDIILDCSAYQKYKIRDFHLDKLNISNNYTFLEEDNISPIKKIYFKLSQILYHILQKILQINNDKIGMKMFNFLNKIGLHYNFDRYFYNYVNSLFDFKVLYGYFQSEKYFQKYKGDIKEKLKVNILLTHKEKNLLKQIKKNNSVGVSIRIGEDYTNSKSLNVCDEDFYYRGMDFIYKKNNDVKFFVFSDCIDKVKSKFDFKYDVTYVEGFEVYQSLRLLYSCEHFVIANSSFSWWGAYLSENKDKIIIAPDKWYNNSKEKPDIYLEDMVLLKT